MISLLIVSDLDFVSSPVPCLGAQDKGKARQDSIKIKIKREASQAAVVQAQDLLLNKYLGSRKKRKEKKRKEKIGQRERERVIDRGQNGCFKQGFRSTNWLLWEYNLLTIYKITQPSQSTTPQE